ncbi:MAG: hypothetical protein JRI25_24965, partial [Deltaproteobacteria bacterium]|nr:hypothetical protein [Deltaproteobacteria bacterium]
MYLRFGLLGTGVLCWMGSRELWNLADVGALPLSVALMLVTGLVGLLLLLCTCGTRIPRIARYLLPIALVLIVADYAQIHEANARLQGGDVTTDVLIFEEYAAHLLLEGVNPYGADLLEAYRAHRTPAHLSTPLIDGTLPGRQPYPALSFLLLVPAQVLGFDADLVYPAFLIGTFLVLYAGVSRRYRPVILLPFLAETIYLGYAFGGVSDTVWCFLLVCMVAAWDRPIGRALLFGLAVSFKQQAWFLAPFLLVRVAWETGGGSDGRGRAMGQFTALVAGVFLAINLPFLVWDPAAWFAGVFEPLRAPMQVFGQGPSVLTAVGWFAIPKGTHTLVSYGLMGVGLLACIRHYPRAPYLLWLVPGIALWFGYRSLNSYWYFLALPFAMDVFNRRPPALVPSVGRHRSLLPELVLASALVVGFTVSAVRAAVGAPGLEITVLGPHEAVGLHISGTWVRVRNATERAIEPRFQVQSHNLQPWFWTIESGPEILEPGQSAVYRIGTKRPRAYLEIPRGGRISVHSADAHQPRVAARIEGDQSVAWPAVAPNGGWKLWTRNKRKPHFWGVVRENSETSRIRYSGDASRGSLTFELDPVAGGDYETLFLDTYMLVPEFPFRIRVKPPRGANRLPDPDIVFGLQLRHGGKRVWVLFGEEEATGRFERNHHYKVIPAPAEEWSTHEIDVRSLLSELGVRVNARRMEMPGFPQLDFPMSPMSFDLMLQARLTEEAVVGHFGEITWGGEA